MDRKASRRRIAEMHAHSYKRVQKNGGRMRICDCGAWLLVVPRKSSGR